MDHYTTLDGIEVFRTGTWRGRPHDEAALDQMVENFERLHDGREFPLYVVDHPTNPTALMAGWASRLYRRGQTLLADFTHVPAAIADLWRQQAFRGVSPGIRYNYAGFEETAGEALNIVFDHLALLTRKPPAIPGLNLATTEGFGAGCTCYAAADYVAPATDGAPDADPSDPSAQTDPSDHPGPDTSAATPEQETTPMPTLEELTAQLAAKEALLAAATQVQENFAALETERGALQEKLAAAELREAERVAADIKRETAATLEQFAAAGKLLPAQRETVEYLLLHAPGDNVEQFAAAGPDGHPATRTYAQTLVAFLGALPNLVEFSARTQRDPAETAAAALTDVQRQAAQRMGISEERYAQQLAAQS